MNAAQTPLLSNGQQTFSRAALDAEVLALAKVLREQGTRVLATLMDNSPAWVVADLAAAQAGLVHVPLPVFFTAQQIGHALQVAGVDTVLGPAALAARWPGAPTRGWRRAGRPKIAWSAPQGHTTRETSIGKNCFIGMGARIQPGTRLGDGCVPIADGIHGGRLAAVTLDR